VRKLLMLAYYFPPLGGAGVQRSAKFAKYLARAGWEIKVISVVPPAYEPFDSSLEREIVNERISVIRVPTGEAFRGLDRIPAGWRIRAGLQDWFLFPDRMASWFEPAYQAAASFCSTNPGVPVFSTSAPYTAHLIGLALKQRFGSPWIADFRDEWTQNPYLRYPSPWHRIRHRNAERRVLAGADLVLSVTDRITDGLRRLAPAARGEFVTIPNGFDPEDFELLQPASERQWLITHVGTLNKARAGLIRPLLEQLRKMVDSGQISADQLRVRLVGSGACPELEELRTGYMEVIDYLPHHQALNVTAASDLLILAESNPSAFTGKIFEYLGVKRPVIGLVHPDSPAANLIREANAGWVLDPTDVTAMREVLWYGYSCWKSKLPAFTPRNDVISRYDRRLQAEKLGELIIKISEQQ
jgi:glycosyltransferase involved in cell wall biosynthesis